MQELILNDIVGSVEANLKVGNITSEDARQLLALTRQLYDHIYKHYEELGGNHDMKPLLDGALELPMDKYLIRIDELEQEKLALEQRAASMEQKATFMEQKATSMEQKATSMELELMELRELLKKNNISTEE